MRRFAIMLCCVFLWPTGFATAQTITEVVNAASRIPSGLPNYGIAKGAIFLVHGTGIGPEEKQQAGFPLPTWDGVGGTYVLVTVGETTVPAPMLYASATELAAIMPSATPAGNGTVTLSFNGQVATAPVLIVDAAFGAFTQNGIGRGPALAFNVSDADPVLNTLRQPARPGQNVMLNGTGAGAIGSDETQSGVTDPVSTGFQVWVGNKEATVVSAGRAACCTGLDPGFPIPQGVAGWDVIQFTVPEGVAGCHVPVAVQAGGLISNFTTIAVAPADAQCADPGGFSAADLAPFTGPVKIGSIGLVRNSMKINIPGMSLEMKTDAGSASFSQFEPAALDASANPFNVSALGSCIVATGRNGLAGLRGTGAPFTVLDAGDAITLKGNGASKQMKKEEGGAYGGLFGTGTSLPFALPGAQVPFLEPGTFTADNGTGGNDVGSFSASLAVPKPLTWTNEDEVVTVDRAQGVTVTWIGGDADSFVNITGISANKDLMGMFVCTGQADAGQFTVPPGVTMSLPASTTDTSAGVEVPTGIMYVQSSLGGKFTAPGIDLGYFTSSVSAMKNLSYK